MTEMFTETAPRRSSRISAQARPEAPTKRVRKGASTAANGSAKSGSARKRPLKEGQEGDQGGDVEREQDAKKVCCVSSACGESRSLMPARYPYSRFPSPFVHYFLDDACDWDRQSLPRKRRRLRWMWLLKRPLQLRSLRPPHWIHP